MIWVGKDPYQEKAPLFETRGQGEMEEGREKGREGSNQLFSYKIFAPERIGLLGKLILGLREAFGY